MKTTCYLHGWGPNIALQMLPSSHQAVHILGDVPGQSVLADVVGSDGEGPVVSVGDHEGILQIQNTIDTET